MKVSAENWHVRYYSDSLGMPRLNVVDFQQRYIVRLVGWWKSKLIAKEMQLLDRSRPNNTIEILQQWRVEDDSYYGKSSDIIILHEGICDCAPRPLPQWLKRWIGTLPKRILDMVVKLIHRNRARIQTVARFHVVKPKMFEHYYSRFLSESSNQCKRLYVITIAPTNAKTEQHSPGLASSIEQYNELILKSVANVKSDRIHIIDAHSLFREGQYASPEYVLDDGHHLTAKAHDLLYQEIVRHEDMFFEKVKNVESSQIIEC